MTAAKESETAHIREKILLGTLAHVPFDGWSNAALVKGCADAGLDREAWREYFPAGVPAVVEYFHAYTDEKTESVLAAENLPTMKMRDRIVTAIRVRLELLARHREAVRRTCAYFALPQNMALGLKVLAATADMIWRAAGDEATDFSFYTKRATLAGVYSATLLYWLDDDSEGFADTFAFLDRRIGDVMELHKAREKFTRGFDEFAEKVGNFFSRPPG